MENKEPREMKNRRARVLLVDLVRLADFYVARLIVWRELRLRRREIREVVRTRRALLSDSPSARRSR